MEMRRLLVKLSILLLVSCKSIASISDVITVDKEDKIAHVEKSQEEGKKTRQIKKEIKTDSRVRGGGDIGLYER